MAYDDAFGIIGKWHVPSIGAVPLSSLGAGVCVHPAGIVLTALHTIENFIATYTIVSPQEADELGRRGREIPAEDHEKPRFVFLNTLVSGGGVVRGTGLREVQVFSIHHVEGGLKSDIAAVAIGPTKLYSPLPYLRPSPTQPVVGENVFFLGHHQPRGTPKDAYGYSAGLTVNYSQGRVEAIIPDRLLVSGEGAKGMSGGPVVDVDSRLVGIISELWPAALSEARIGINLPLIAAVPVALGLSSIARVAAHEGIAPLL